MTVPDAIDVLILCSEQAGNLDKKILSAIQGVHVRCISDLRQLHTMLRFTSVHILLIDSYRKPGHSLMSSPSHRMSAAAESLIESDCDAVLRLLNDELINYIYQYDIHEDVLIDTITAILHDKREKKGARLSVFHVVKTELRGVVGNSPPMQTLCALIKRVAPTQRPVLILGPSGSGKDILAQAIHRTSPFSEGNFIDINCGAIPESLFDSHLFGHEKGSFTGATRTYEGYFSAADNGTLFLDEIAELPLVTQSKLLRVLDSGYYRRLGSNERIHFGGRIVAATNADLEKKIEQGTFREDLYYRLNVFSIQVPPLSARRSDIPALVNYFARRQHRLLFFTPEAMKRLIQADWRGHIRELRNVIDQIAVLSDEDPVTGQTIEQYTRIRHEPDQKELEALANDIMGLRLPDTLKAVEGALVKNALKKTGGNKSAAARLLGVHRKVIERRIG